MKLASFQVQTPVGRFVRIGSVQGERLIDLSSAYVTLLAQQGEPQPYRLMEALVPPDMRRLIEGGERALEAARAAEAFAGEALARGQLPAGPQGEQLVFALNEVRLLPPLPRPNSLRDCLVFEKHMRRGYDALGLEPPRAWYEMPVYYKGNPCTLLGHDEDLVWPAYTERLDYELELACIIGKEGRDIPPEEADRYIFGFACLNDFSARDIQMREMQCRLGPAKGKDFGTALGPWIVTRDEIGDYQNLRMVARVNGEVWSEGNSRDMYHSWANIIAHLSMGETLYPSDVVGSGTVGLGCGLELDRWLKPGDVVEIEIEKIGVLRNRVVKP
ncbi:MAG: 2-hydroxyhepta-2,4-diene-1,7-dioate isomerase [Candidatus Tectimicrobiota bacterium]|nr:MAG: 2-hydroxyhepta-2,4-diene-1,7-dioate isomerase [Candidatus Tectomicrobia bacterium]